MLTFDIEYPEQNYPSGTQVYVRVNDKAFFWSEPATVTKRSGERAQISYGSGGHQQGVDEVFAIRAKANAMLRAAEIADELNALYE